MQWDDSIRDALQRSAPYLIWVFLVLVTSTLAAIIRDPLSRLLRESSDQLRALRRRLLSRSAVALGRRSHRFWLARQHEPARAVAGSLERLAEALPQVGRKSLARVTTLQTDLERQIGLLQALRLNRPSAPVTATNGEQSVPGPRGSWWRLLALAVIAGLTGLANSFLLNEFFQGVITSGALFPTAFPDFHVSHVFAVLIFMMEVAIGFALHYFAQDQEDQNVARGLLALAPWVVLIGLVCLEGWAYALLSYQIDIPERLNLSAGSGLYTFARYFLAVFGAGLTLLLTSLGYLLGRESERLRATAEARREERLLQRYGGAISQASDQVERTERALLHLRAAAQSFQLNLVHQFKQEIETAGSSSNLLAAVRDAMADVLDSARQVDVGSERWIDRFQSRERRPIRTRSQALADMCLFTAAMGLLVTVSWVSIEYVAGFIRSVQGNRASSEVFAIASGVLMTAFALSTGYMAREAWSGTRYGYGTRTLVPHSGSRRLLRILAVAFLSIAIGGLIAVALANRTLGPSTPLNLLFGLLHAGLLTILGAAADAAIVNTLHVLELLSVYLLGCLVGIQALVLQVLRALLVLLDWAVRLVAVFGQLVVRPRPKIRYGVAEVSDVGLPRETVQTPRRRITDRTYGRAVRS
jgi:hypothetical protein